MKVVEAENKKKNIPGPASVSVWLNLTNKDTVLFNPVFWRDFFQNHKGFLDYFFRNKIIGEFKKKIIYLNDSGIIDKLPNDISEM